MKWNLLLVLVSTGSLIMFFGAELGGYMMQADYISEQLAPQIGVEVNVIRGPLQKILRDGSLLRAFGSSVPLALLSLLLMIRLAREGP